MDFPDYPFTFMHRDHQDQKGCGRPIAYLRRKPTREDVLSSSDAIHLDGRPIEFESAGQCDSCGEYVKYGMAVPLSFVEPRQGTDRRMVGQ